MKRFALRSLPIGTTTQAAIQTSVTRQARYARLIVGVMAAVLILVTGWLSTWRPGQFRPLLDFDAFYIVAQRVWLGDVERTYHFDQFERMQLEAIGGNINFLGHWTYPPQFNLFIAPLGLVHVGVAYFLFVSITLGLYLTTLRAISKDCFPLVVTLLSPALLLTLFGGQNGFLTGSLAGLTCLAIERRQILAGCSLGLMVIKPHLAAGIAVYALFAPRWRAVITAVAIIILSSILCTLLFGVQIWNSFISSARDLSAYYADGRFDLYRSVSFYAVLRSLGSSTAFALLGQATAALTALSVVAMAIYRKLPARWSMGIAVIASLMVSPYAYDYDLPILAVGMALLLPDLQQLASNLERRAIYGLTFASSFYGLFQVIRIITAHDERLSIEQPALSGLVIAVLLWLIVRVLFRTHYRAELES